MTIFFFNDTATTEIYTLSLHDALPIWKNSYASTVLTTGDDGPDRRGVVRHRSRRATGRNAASDPGHHADHRTGKPRRLHLGLPRWNRVGRQAAGFVPAKILLRHLPDRARSRRLSHRAIPARQMAGQPLGQGRTQAFV